MIAEVAQSTSRLMEALEKLGEWAGSGTGGNGPSGSPSDEVVRAFEEAMAEPAEEAGGVAIESGNADFAPPTADLAEPLLPGPAESVPPPDGRELRVSGSEKDVPGVTSGEAPAPVGVNAAEQSEGVGQRPEAVEVPDAVHAGEQGAAPENSLFRVEAPRAESPVRELGRLLEEFSRPGASIGPEALFRVQYLVGMLKVQMQAGLKTSQNASQGMESVLRQQG